MAWRLELCESVDHPHLSLLRELRQAAGQPTDDLVFPGPQAIGVDLRFAEGDAVFGHRRRIVDDLGSMQQGFGRDAADIQADAAQHRIALDQDDVQSQVRRPERRRVPARSCADDDKLGEVRRLGQRRRIGVLLRVDGSEDAFLLLRFDDDGLGDIEARRRRLVVFPGRCLIRIDRRDDVAGIDVVTDADRQRDDGASG